MHGYLFMLGGIPSWQCGAIHTCQQNRHLVPLIPRNIGEGRDTYMDARLQEIRNFRQRDKVTNVGWITSYSVLR